MIQKEHRHLVRFEHSTPVPLKATGCGAVRAEAGGTDR